MNVILIILLVYFEQGQSQSTLPSANEIEEIEVIMTFKYCQSLLPIHTKTELVPAKDFEKFKSKLSDKTTKVPVWLSFLCDKVSCNGTTFKIDNCKESIICDAKMTCRTLKDIPTWLGRDEKSKVVQPWWFPNDRIM